MSPMRRVHIASAVCTLIMTGLPHSVSAQQVGQPQETYATARVLSVVQEQQEAMPDEQPHRVQTLRLRIVSGPEAGKEFTAENGMLTDRPDAAFHTGDLAVVRKLTKIDGSTAYLVQEKERLQGLLWLVLGFFLLAWIFGGRVGLASIVGLAVSVAILMLFIIPQIIRGWNPLAVSMIGACAIACTSLYLAHGFTRRTTIALGSTLCVLAASAILSVIAVHIASLFGMGSEESIFLQTGQLQNLDLRGLLLGGMIIGCLGVLDDITTAQTAAIDEIQKANPAMSQKELIRAGESVGREHIASLINTLALAYVGASLPLLLLFWTSADIPLWVILNSEFLSEEIVRTLVGSATLILAVPVSTWMAARAFHGRPARPVPHPSSSFHSHSH